MNGAEALINTLFECGVEVCFANPGTSEMQLVAAIDKHEEMRAILGLFEGVVTGAADGYGRMTDKPAATLLHLGPGLANGCANLHNARRAHSPIVNLIGDHADGHLQYDAPLTSDIDGIARPFSDWLDRSTSHETLAQSGANAAAAAMSYGGQVATLVVPADHAWTDDAAPAVLKEATHGSEATTEILNKATNAIGGEGKTAIYLGGHALREEALGYAGRIAAKTGASIICETFPARLQRGEGRVPIQRLPYFGEMAAHFLSEYDTLILIGAQAPVSFFAYPGKPSWLAAETSMVIDLAVSNDRAKTTLARLAAMVDADNLPVVKQERLRPDVGDGNLNALAIGSILAQHLPENAIIVDEAATTGGFIYENTQGAQKHDWLTLTGGSIGQGLPVAVGAAIARPHQKVVALQADGSGMYTLQALWTMAREKLNVVTVILNNGSYAILNIELLRVGVENPGPKARSLLDLKNPPLDWVSLARGMGVSAIRTETAVEFDKAFERAIALNEPQLIEAMV